MKLISGEHLKKVRSRVAKDGGIQPQFVSLPEGYKDRVDTTNVQSRKILEKISECSMLLADCEN